MHILKFQSLIGKLQTVSMMRCLTASMCVSIPHREATNASPRVIGIWRRLFQSLIGKLQTELVSVIGHQGTAFQSLIGKLQTIDTEVSMVGEENARFNPS